MIVCSCNLLSDGDVKACLTPGPGCPRTPAQVYNCLGCSPNCGRCARTIRSIMDKALAEAGALPCSRGCCPAGGGVVEFAVAAEAAL
ncbi:MAG: (2Fe-2S)-binding protein [Microvirga sp.]